MKQIQIALLGFGTVATGVYAILNEQKDHITRQLKRQTGQDIEVCIKKILVRTIEKYPLEVQTLMTVNPDDIFLDDDIKIVCELIGGNTIAPHYIQCAIEHNKHIITANKMAIFKDGGQFIKQANEAGVQMRFEAAVAGVIPIIRALEESLISDSIESIQAILNGSTNFILTQISRGHTYDEAFEIATQLGYLEADPSSDIGGYDAMYKLGILAYLATGTFPSETSIKRIGISEISGETIKTAYDNHQKIKLINSLSFENHTLSLSVQPELLSSDHPLYSIDGAQNGILIRLKYAGELFFSGAGAGSRETATAVIGDITNIIKNKEYIT